MKLRLNEQKDWLKKQRDKRHKILILIILNEGSFDNEKCSNECRNSRFKKIGRVY